MRKVDTKDLLKYALKKKEDIIQIEGKFADEVMIRYSHYLNSEPFPPGLAMLLPITRVIGMAAYLQYYKIDKYERGEILVISKI